VIGVSNTLEVRGDEERFALGHGGVATSSTEIRSWRRGDKIVNHIVDPRTGQSANGRFCTATVVAGDCVQANALATAALVFDDADDLLQRSGVSARLVARDGSITYAGNWPLERVS
jgi:thiamine biosynthesis lipoprotein